MTGTSECGPLYTASQTDLSGELSQQCGLTGVTRTEGVCPPEQRGGLHMQVRERGTESTPQISGYTLHENMCANFMQAVVYTILMLQNVCISQY